MLADNANSAARISSALHDSFPASELLSLINRGAIPELAAEQAFRAAGNRCSIRAAAANEAWLSRELDI